MTSRSPDSTTSRSPDSETSPISDPLDPRVSWWPTLGAFGVLALASLATAFYTNTAVLTDDVYRSLIASQGGGAQAEALLAQSEQWALFGYLLNPVWLAVKVGGAALVVQLGLLAFRVRAPFVHAFRAGVWAQWALLLGVVVQAVRLGLMPAAARTSERLGEVPGSGEWLLSGFGPFDPLLSGLLQQITVYQVGWVAIFVLALESGKRIPARPTVVVVTSVWILSVLARWGLWSYLDLGGLG